MRINKYVTGAIVGLAAGFIVANQINKREITPEKALHNVKHALKDKLAIEGSWIQMFPEKMEKNDLLEYTVYRGGVTSNEHNRIQHYDFTVDAETGAIIELK
ncbi:PepSY domain-containing protein [Pueribacillus sp. YX66]|uniref:PepSY domain-containing protein n=1 Tax=Pueribacillus sp. YX66 TaxID=3229242 RepID=UPI00358D328B